MQAKKLALGLSLVVAVIASTFTTETLASQQTFEIDGKKVAFEILVKSAGEVKKNAPFVMTKTRWALLALGLATVPYIVNYLTRKPQEDPRFDKDKLLYGSLTEKLKQIHYFISDTVIGWPYKNKKIVIKEDDSGKDTIGVQSEQLPGGWFGNAEAWVLKGGSRAIMYPATVMLYLGAWSAGLQWWANPSTEFPDKKIALALLLSNMGK